MRPHSSRSAKAGTAIALYKFPVGLSICRQFVNSEKRSFFLQCVLSADLPYDLYSLAVKVVDRDNDNLQFYMLLFHTYNLLLYSE